MTTKELKDFISENYYRRIQRLFTKEKLLFNKTSKEKFLLSLATKLIKNI